MISLPLYRCEGKHRFIVFLFKWLVLISDNRCVPTEKKSGYCMHILPRSQLCVIHLDKNKAGREGRGLLVKCLLVPRLLRHLIGKVQYTPYLIHFVCSVCITISFNIISVLQPTAVWFSKGLVSRPRAQHLSPFLSPPLSHSLSLRQPSSASFAPGWLITGRSNIFEFMGGSSHTVLALGAMCSPALPFPLPQTAMIQLEF